MNHAMKSAVIFDHDHAHDLAYQEILEAVEAGESIRCGNVTASPKDFAEVLACRHDFEDKIIALVRGDLSALALGRWITTVALSDYASDMAVHLVSAKAQDAFDAAEYAQGDR